MAPYGRYRSWKPSAPSAPGDSSRTRRAHTYSRLTTAIAVLALAIAGYSLVRLDSMRDKLDTANATLAASNSDRELLRAELKSQASRERQAHRDLNRRLDTLSDAPQQLQELASSVEELRGRAEGPERAWSRSEALFLLELAQRRLTLDRDVETAIVALESADLRLASLRDRVVRCRSPGDRQGAAGAARRAAAGHHRHSLPPDQRRRKRQRRAGQRHPGDRAQCLRSQQVAGRNVCSRPHAFSAETFSNLIVVRKVDDRVGQRNHGRGGVAEAPASTVVIFAARTAVIRHDEQAYRTALAGARRSLGEFFDLSKPETQALLNEVQALEPINVDPAAAERDQLDQRAAPDGAVAPGPGVIADEKRPATSPRR